MLYHMHKTQDSFKKNKNKNVHYYFNISCLVLFDISPSHNNIETDITKQHLEISSGYRNFNLILSTSTVAQRKKL